ncbi:fibronectin type III domain-containing protein [Streptomyces sp. NBC_00268]|uniref:fibronectin type III domain-containing protein n=1 Tax=Streptomyces sp. NBC_00268 TaxID=2975695 RepID=UPI00225505AF|nr:PA14 domain-containing protein [Streptomyces sp. NBC_00268]MCX5186135.1 PA14 domain-containing protein [Streptomyces sp. NBC_00268]
MRPVGRGGPALAATLTIATTGGLLAVSEVPASAASSCASPAYKRQFYANTTFSGTPKKTDCDTTVNENWGTKAPASGLPKDNFGIRWTVTRDFGSGGPFALPVAAQDGLRVYLDGTRKIDLWKNVSSTVKKTVNVTIPSGKHTLRVDYANWTGAANVTFGYTPRTTATVDKVKPLTPTGTSVSYDTAGGNTRLSWAKNKEMDLAGYRVYRRLKGSTTWTRLTTTTATSYTDTPPATGDTYYYEVRAHDKAGNESTGTADQAVTTVDRTPTGAPGGLNAKVSTGSVALGWSKVPGAAAYRVYRSSAPQGPFQQLASSLSDVSYRDTSADIHQRLYYRVTALDTAGNESVPSATADTGAPDTLAPGQVTGLTAEGTTAGNALRWNAPSDDVEHYEVWAAPEGQSDPDGPDLVLGTSFNDFRAAAGTAVTYTVQAVDAYGNISPVSEAVIATRPAPGDAAAPTGVTVTPQDSGTELTWAISVDGVMYGTRVYRRTDASAAWSRVGSPHATLFSDTEAPAGRASYYVVVLDAQGRESAPSDVVSVDRITPATSTGPLPPLLTLSTPYTECTANDCAGHGGPGQAATVTMTRPAGDDRVIRGYQWHVTGGAYAQTTNGSFTWTPPTSGTYIVEVATVDAYGRVGPSTHLTFKVA